MKQIEAVSKMNALIIVFQFLFIFRFIKSEYFMRNIIGGLTGPLTFYGKLQ